MKIRIGSIRFKKSPFHEEAIENNIESMSKFGERGRIFNSYDEPKESCKTAGVRATFYFGDTNKLPPINIVFPLIVQKSYEHTEKVRSKIKSGKKLFIRLLDSIFGIAHDNYPLILYNLQDKNIMAVIDKGKVVWFESVENFDEDLYIYPDFLKSISD